MKHIYVITGGTVVHVSPHFSLCAPAYGSVGQGISDRLSELTSRQGIGHELQVHLIRTRMAGQNSDETTAHLNEWDLPAALETNEDLHILVKEILNRAETIAIVMAAAVCDFEPAELTAVTDTHTVTRTQFGKDQSRLHHVRSLSLSLIPSNKIVDLVKQRRPDVLLVTFKTTAGVSERELIEQARHNLSRSGSDFVLANDIQNHRSLVVTSEGDILQGQDRQATLDELCKALMHRISVGSPRD